MSGLAWGDADGDYVAVTNIVLAAGYSPIGRVPCIRAVSVGENPRVRWRAGSAKIGCEPTNEPGRHCVAHRAVRGG